MTWKYIDPPLAPVREAAAHATDEDDVVVTELTNDAEAITEMLDIFVTTDIVHQ